ncbi:hypothetical protein J4430_00930 [Candidatus Woesearchaeota archaeon]|nr:hypothetical protein [Candidatus Woesearchaeota archaeon]
MNEKDVLEALGKVREGSKKRKFVQSFDLIINLKQLNLKKPEHKIDLFVTIDSGIGKKRKVCALVDKELMTEAKKTFDIVISKGEFSKLTKKDIKKLAKENDFFVAQATIMTDVAKVFGRILGSRGLMPNPKAGCVVLPTAQLGPIYQRLQHLIRLQVKAEPIVKVCIGSEAQDDSLVAKNIITAYNAVMYVLPQEKNNIKNALLKVTMGTPIQIKV